MKRRGRPRRPTRALKAFALALMSCLAVAAVSASTASALSFHPPSRPEFTVSGGGIETYEERGYRMWCNGETTGTAKMEDETRGTVTLRFHGCEGFIPGAPKCTSEGAEKGEIVTSPLSMKLVELPKEEGIGMLFKPISPGAPFAKFDCGAVPKDSWSGGVIGKITEPGYGTHASTLHVAFFASSGSTQAYTETADGQKAHLEESINGSANDDMSLTGNVTMTLVEGGEFTLSPEAPEKGESPYLYASGGLPKATSWLGGEVITLESADGKHHVTCSSELKVEEGKLSWTLEGSGEFVNHTEGTAELTLHECKTVFGIKCTTAGQKTGTVKTELLPVSLTYREDGSPGLYFGQNKSSGKFMEMNCSFAGKVVVTGGVEGSITSPELNGDPSLLQIEMSKEPGLQTSWNGSAAAAATLDADSGLVPYGSYELREAKPFS